MMSQTSQERTHQSILTAMGPDVRDFMADDSIIEVMCNPDGKLWVERLGEGMADSGKVLDPARAMSLLRLVASNHGTQVTEQSPSLAAVLPVSGARFQGLLPPVVSAPSFTIRKKAKKIFSLCEYVEQGVLTQKQALQLKEAFGAKKNILIAGGTGSGKTTLANAILDSVMDSNERFVLIEDVEELQCSSPNQLRFLVNHDIGYTAQKALKDTLRCRPDRIIVGEVRDGSALDLLKAWNTGHNGGIATIHANSAKMALKRLESLVQEAVITVPHELISEAIDMVVFIERTPKGRVVGEIALL